MVASQGPYKAIPRGGGGVDRDCHARCDLVSTLEKINLDAVHGPLGAELPDVLMWEIVRGVRAAIGDNSDL